MVSVRSWTESDIAAFKGQEETIRLEFKAGALLTKPESAWVSDLSREISAFANTEGGVLILGLPEEKIGKTRVASNPDGVPGEITKDSLQRKLEGNLFPYLPGIRVTRVPLSSLESRAVFVIEVPQGSTAYQANDGRYYGRSELEAKHLPDHEIRVRMARGKVARAALFLRLRSLSLSSHRHAELRAQHSAAVEAFANDAESAFKLYPDVLLELMAAKSAPDEVRVELWLRNEGELTIRDPSVEWLEPMSTDSFGNPRPGSDIARVDMAGETIYPGDERLVSGSTREIRCKPGKPIEVGDFAVVWRVFLDNAPPSSGDLDLGNFLQTEREAALARQRSGG